MAGLGHREFRRFDKSVNEKRRFCQRCWSRVRVDRFSNRGADPVIFGGRNLREREAGVEGRSCRLWTLADGELDPRFRPQAEEHILGRGRNTQGHPEISSASSCQEKRNHCKPHAEHHQQRGNRPKSQSLIPKSCQQVIPPCEIHPADITRLREQARHRPATVLVTLATTHKARMTMRGLAGRVGEERNSEASAWGDLCARFAVTNRATTNKP